MCFDEWLIIIVIGYKVVDSINNSSIYILEILYLAKVFQKDLYKSNITAI